MSTIKTNQLAHTANGATVFTLPQADGSANQAIKTDGSGSLGFTSVGKILQVVGATINTEASTTSTTMADTGLTASITPSASTSKILVLIQMPYMFIRSSGSKSAGGFNVVRASTDIFRSYYHNGESEYHYPYFEYNNNITSMTIRGMLNWSILDEPDTTSPTAYKVQFSRGMSTSVYINPYNNGSYRPFSSINLLEVGA